MTEYFVNELINNPELYADGITLLRMDLAIRLIPFVVTLAIACDRVLQNRKNVEKIVCGAILFVLDMVLSIATYLLSHFVILGDVDIDHTIEMISRVWFSYQDYGYVGASLFICIGVAIVWGYLLRTIAILIVPNKERNEICFKSLSKPVRAFILGTGSVGLLLSITLLYKGFSGVNHIVINEVCGNNLSIAINEEYDVCDYVEIYNLGEHACVTDELYLSDDLDELEKFEVPRFTMTNFGRAAVSLKDAPFGISKDGGEIIYLSDGVGNIIDSVKIVKTGENQSYSRIYDGADEWVVTGCTPNQRNEESIDRIDGPAFSADSGFYESDFDLTLTAAEGVSIYYTIDGSEPSMDSYLYDGNIHIYDRSAEENRYRSLINVVEDWQDGHYEPDTEPVDKAFVVRAVAIADDRHISDVITKTYFVNLDKYKKYPVLSIVGNPSDLFGDNGIYVTGVEYDEWVNAGKPGDYVYPNFARRDRFNEAKVSVEYIDDNNVVAQLGGIRIRGNSSYGHWLKPFSLFARKDYSGSRYFDKSLFDSEMTHSFGIRGGYANTVYPYMVSGRDVATLKSFIGVIFINGEFWYTGSCVEKFNKDYFQEYYGVSPDNIIILQDKVLQEGNDDETYVADDIDAFLDSLDMANDNDYALFCEKFDVQSYIDLMCIDLYITNTDHGDFTQNDILWRSREKRDEQYNDGRWRWCLYDLDECDVWSKGNRAAFDNTDWLMSQPLFKRLIVNEQFKKQFLDSFIEIVDECFSEDNVKKAMNMFDFAGTIGYKSNYQAENVDGSIDDHERFFATRRDYIVSYMEKAFNVELE